MYSLPQCYKTLTLASYHSGPWDSPAEHSHTKGNTVGVVLEKSRMPFELGFRQPLDNAGLHIMEACVDKFTSIFLCTSCVNLTPPLFSQNYLITIGC